MRTVKERLYSRLREEPGPLDTPCLVFTGFRNADGYGKIAFKGEARSAHRVAWILEHGDPPASTPQVLHHCDNPPCCRISHLYIGTPADNARDKVRRGRAKGEPPVGERHHWAKLTEQAVLDIRRRYAAGETGRRLATEYGVTFSLISCVVLRKCWRHLP